MRYVRGAVAVDGRTERSAQASDVDRRRLERDRELRTRRASSAGRPSGDESSVVHDRDAVGDASRPRRAGAS